MKLLKNIAVGFIVSFLGSVPLGYLNIAGFEIYSRSGIDAVFLYLLGVISIEGIVIYSTLIFADWLMHHKKLIQWIEGFSVMFMFLVAYIFYANAHATASEKTAVDEYIRYSPYIIGVILSCFNFIQIPFWTAWNLYLLNAGYIDVDKNRKYFYVMGTICGTFAGIMTLIMCLHYITTKTEFLSKYLMGVIIPLGFATMGIYQVVKFYRKYYTTPQLKK